MGDPNYQRTTGKDRCSVCDRRDPHGHDVEATLPYGIQQTKDMHYPDKLAALKKKPVEREVLIPLTRKRRRTVIKRVKRAIAEMTTISTFEGATDEPSRPGADSAHDRAGNPSDGAGVQQQAGQDDLIDAVNRREADAGGDPDVDDPALD